VSVYQYQPIYEILNIDNATFYKAHLEDFTKKEKCTYQNKTFDKNFDEEKNTKFIGYSLIAVGAILFIKRFPLFHWINFRLLFPILLVGAGLVVLGKSFKK